MGTNDFSPGQSSEYLRWRWGGIVMVVVYCVGLLIAGGVMLKRASAHLEKQIIKQRLQFLYGHDALSRSHLGESISFPTLLVDTFGSAISGSWSS